MPILAPRDRPPFEEELAFGGDVSVGAGTVVVAVGVDTVNLADMLAPSVGPACDAVTGEPFNTDETVNNVALSDETGVERLEGGFAAKNPEICENPPWPARRASLGVGAGVAGVLCPVAEADGCSDTISKNGLKDSHIRPAGGVLLNTDPLFPGIMPKQKKKFCKLCTPFSCVVYSDGMNAKDWLCVVVTGSDIISQCQLPFEQAATKLAKDSDIWYILYVRGTRAIDQVLVEDNGRFVAVV
jgi:hypothetical protein